MAVPSHYKPPTQVRTFQMPYKAMVLRANPDFGKDVHKEPFYRFSNGRAFNEDTSRQGPYSTVPNIR